jgi:CheY-like chemotaxis protein
MTTILIVDDNDDDRYMLRVLLEGHGYEVMTATNGIEALEIAQRDPPDLLVTDILMPGMDGFSLCRHWKQDPHLQTIPFVFYTATYTDPRDRDFALHLGADRFIVKPEEIDVLVGLLVEVIEAGKGGGRVSQWQRNRSI